MCPSEEQLQEKIVLFHDDSIFSANEDQGSQWGEKDSHVIKPKSKGSGIMVSDFTQIQSTQMYCKCYIYFHFSTHILIS